MSETHLKLAASPRDWIAVDWGTSSLRAWYVQNDGFVQTNARSTQGAGSLTSSEFERVLLDLVGPWLKVDNTPLPVVICGMAGSRQGWVEAPYVPLPASFSELAQNVVRAPMRDTRLAPVIVPGVCQNNAAGPDVIRGEETLLLGLLSEAGTQRRTFCLPGTHSKWVHTENHRMLCSRTFLTGELFALVSQKSILRHSLEGSGDMDLDAFRRGVTDIKTGSASFLGSLFSIRASHLLNGTDPHTAYAYLSGLIIGTELKELQESGQLKPGDVVDIIANSALTRGYSSALTVFGATACVHDGDMAALKGLSKIRKDLTDDLVSN